MSRLDWKGLLLGLPARLRYVRRFSTCRTTHHETVAEHCYYTALYTMLLCESLAGGDDRNWCYNAIVKALVHDLEEARTGDIPRPFKYQDAQLTKDLNRAGMLAFEEIVRDITPDVPLRALLHNRWTHAKDGDSGRVVAFADYLSCLSYIGQEVEDNNLGMLEHTVAMKAYGELFLTKDYDFLQPRITEVLALAKELLGDENA